MCSDAIEFSETQRAGLRWFVYGQGPVTIRCGPLGKADSGRSTAGEGLCSGGAPTHNAEALQLPHGSAGARPTGGPSRSIQAGSAQGL